MARKVKFHYSPFPRVLKDGDSVSFLTRVTPGDPNADPMPNKDVPRRRVTGTVVSGADLPAWGIRVKVDGIREPILTFADRDRMVWSDTKLPVVCRPTPRLKPDYE